MISVATLSNTDMWQRLRQLGWVFLRATIALLLLPIPVHASKPIIHQTIEQPRNIGYMLGDEIVHRLEVKIRKPYTLVEDGLPKKGRVSDYAMLSAVKVSQTPAWGATRYKISFHYQVTNYSNKLVGTMIPASIVNFASTDDVYPVVLTPWGFTVSPYLLSGNRDSGEMPELLPLMPQPVISLVPGILKVLVTGLLALLLFMPVVHRTILAPLQARARRPFRTAYRAIARLSAGQPGSAQIESATQAMHRAFNETLSQTVLSTDVERLLQLHPAFKPHKKQIERFFSWSDDYFYNSREAETTSAEGSGPGFTVKRLKKMAAQLRRCE